jgi:hypothetical protein
MPGAAGAPTAAGAPAGAAGPQPPPQNPLEQRVERLEQRAEAEDRADEQRQEAQQAEPRHEREPLQRADDSTTASGPAQAGPGSGAAPIVPPQRAAQDVAQDDATRNL